jgi:hypothetical protein
MPELRSRSQAKLAGTAKTQATAPRARLPSGGASRVSSGEARPVVAVAVVGFVLVEGMLPPVALIAIGWATGHIPAAVRDGLGSPAGHALLGSLFVGAAAYGLSLLRGPLEDLLSAYCAAIMSVDLQRRLANVVHCQSGLSILSAKRCSISFPRRRESFRVPAPPTHR